MVARPDVDLEIVNRSTESLRNTTAHFDDSICEWGAVGKTFTAAYLFFPNPVSMDVELHWDESSGHRVEKIDLRKIYPAGKSGRLTFTVFDDRVEATFKPAE